MGAALIGLLGLLIAIAIVFLLVGAVLAVIWLIVEFVFRLLAAAAVATITGLSAAGLGLTDDVSVLIGFVSFVAAILLIWKWRGPLAEIFDDRKKATANQPQPVQMVSVRPWPEADKEIERSWDQIAARCADKRDALRTARDACGDLLWLETKDRVAATYELSELAATIRENIRELAREIERAEELGEDDASIEIRCHAAEGLLAAGERSATYLGQERTVRNRDAIFRAKHLRDRMSPDRRT